MFHDSFIPSSKFPVILVSKIRGGDNLMRKSRFVAVLAVLGLLVATAAFAGPWSGERHERGYGYGYGPGVNSEALKNFQKETLPLRDELLAKRLEIREEYAKETPDLQKLASLKKEMVDLETRITESARKNGIERWGRGPFGEGREDRGGNCPYRDAPRGGWGSCWR
jgi:zinc resistance-associated protein